jgi:hypothetical protein
VTVTRRLSVHSDEDDDAVAPLSRNSLEGTRRYVRRSLLPCFTCSHLLPSRHVLLRGATGLC